MGAKIMVFYKSSNRKIFIRLRVIDKFHVPLQLIFNT